MKSEIKQGLVVLLGISADDCLDDIEWLCQRLLLFEFSDEQGKMNQSLLDVDGLVILISQFTLFASTKRESTLLCSFCSS